MLYEVITAQAELPQLIVLDVMMPEMDGIETCEELQRIPELSNSMITFLTARGKIIHSYNFV